MSTVPANTRSQDSLRGGINGSALLHHAENFQAIAYSTPERNRVFGSLGYNFSALYIYKHLEALSDYYDITWQPFTTLYSEYNVSLTVSGTDQGPGRLTHSPSGQVEAPIIAVSNQGCNAADFPAGVKGNIALIVRGDCPYGLKSAYAGAAGAAGVIIYNNADGDKKMWGTLIERSRPQGAYPPSVMVSQTTGKALAASLASGKEVVGNLTVQGVCEDRVTMNLFAQTRGGDQNNVLVLGAHADSVIAGPGIQDNASGVSCLLEVALALAKYKTTNAVRFAWWSAEEFGLVGSDYYVNKTSDEDLAKIRLYLNFDIIASPNFILGVYDGDGSDTPTGQYIGAPAGSGQAEALFTQYLTDVRRQSAPIYFNDRSDYAAFLAVGIPATGPFTGAEGIKSSDEMSMFGGTAGAPYDPNYHQEGDTVDNLSMEAFLVNTQATAHAVATFSTSFESLGTAARVKRSESLVPPHTHATGCQQHSHGEDLGL